MYENSVAALLRSFFVYYNRGLMQHYMPVGR